ncbi:MAG: DUF5106 domain-containing protein [Pseudoflavonifractor sp.]|nr:DUF5106 domain-containing protein [Alloprevotella sp.]MCM1116497.1 DUF5106 domain-containing protein [Pseudoflavonifractor sp.]
MFHRLIIILAILCAIIMGTAPLSAQDEGLLFPMPDVPDEISINERPDYVIAHYWDKCNFKSVLSSKERYVKAFDTYVDMMKATSRRAAMRSIYLFLEKLEKYPDVLLYTAELAESMMYGPSATFQSDEAYLPFARAVAANKKISKAEKARFGEQARIISQSSKGMTAPKLEYVDSVGATHRLETDSVSIVILFFNEPDCFDCIIARGRLAANPNLNTLISQGAAKVVAITPSEGDETWRSQAAKYPANWTVGAAEDVYDIYDIRHTPTIYILNKERSIISKDTSVDELVNMLSNLF